MSCSAQNQVDHNGQVCIPDPRSTKAGEGFHLPPRLELDADRWDIQADVPEEVVVHAVRYARSRVLIRPRRSPWTLGGNSQVSRDCPGYLAWSKTPLRKSISYCWMVMNKIISWSEKSLLEIHMISSTIHKLHFNIRVESTCESS